MTLVKITDKLYFTFNEEFTTIKLKKDIPINCNFIINIDTHIDLNRFINII